MVRNTAKNPNGRRKKSSGKSRDASPEPERDGFSGTGSTAASADGPSSQSRRNGGWREIEARREKAALKASLADVWDEDFDLDEEILAELDHTAEFFTTQEDPEEEIFEDDEVEVDEYFEDDEV
ncbi:MAG: hypothetical protein OQK01_00380 [Xanthomonadales bacterium]|nr:hypothetical protein [Xanthomonadales bacterium]